MKHNRHIKILSIIQEKCIKTQEELAETLLNSGYNVTQATVSRDIKDLKLVKKTDEKGNVRYTADKKNKEVISIRGWRYLTGMGGMKLDESLAAKLQDDFAEWVIEKISK